MFRTIAATFVVLTAFTLAACGSGETTRSSGGVAPETAKARIERAAGVKLAVEPVPADAREQGLRASYSNARTAVRDQQVVGLFVMRNAKVASKVSEMVRSSAPKSARLLVNGEVIVVYSAAGADHAADVERAVKELS
jgi:predicted small secreted protein